VLIPQQVLRLMLNLQQVLLQQELPQQVLRKVLQLGLYQQNRLEVPFPNQQVALRLRLQMRQQLHRLRGPSSHQQLRLQLRE
jgi:hypothetical protein